MPKTLSCPNCGARFRVQLQPGLNRIACPECCQSIKVEVRANSEKRSEHSDEPKPKQAEEAAEHDTYSLASPPSEPQASAPRPSDDVTKEPAPAVVNEPHEQPRPKRKKPHRKTSSAPETPLWKRKEAVWAGGGLLSLVLLAVVMFSIFGNGDGGSPGGTVDVPDEVGLSDGEFVVISEAPPGAAPSVVPTSSPEDDETYLGLAPAESAAAVAPGGTRQNPGEWKPLPKSDPEPAIERRPTSQLPVAFNHEHYVILSFASSPPPPKLASFETPQLRPVNVRNVYWRKHSWTTGEPAGPFHWLGADELPAPRTSRNEPEPLSHFVAALSPDGSQFAAEIPSAPGGVRVWRGDGSSIELAVADDNRPIRWIDWSDSGRLITLSAGGTLAGWPVDGDEADRQPLWTTQGGETSFVTRAPGRTWLALGAGSTIHLVTSDEGRSLGTLHCGAEHPLRDMAVSPDGQTLAAFYFPAMNELPRNARRHAGSDGVASTLSLWNLADGAALTATVMVQPLGEKDLERASVCFRSLRWFDTRRLLINRLMISDSLMAGRSSNSHVYGKSYLYDIETSELLGAVQLTDRHTGMLPQPLDFDSAGGAWLNTADRRNDSDHFLPVTYLDPELVRHQEIFPQKKQDQETQNRSSADVPLQIAVDAGSAEASRMRGESIARYLVGKGFKIGPGGDTLRVKFRGIDRDGTPPQEFSGHLLIRDADREGAKQLTTETGSVSIPYVMGSWRLFDASGREYWDVGSREYWSISNSKYLVADSAKPGGPGDWVRDPYAARSYSFDFGRKDVKQAIMDEILRRETGASRVLFDLRGVIERRGGFQVPEPFLSALETIEADDSTDDERDAAMDVIASHLDDPALEDRYRSDLRKIVDRRDDAREVEMALRNLKIPQFGGKRRPPIVTYARAQPSDFADPSPSAAELEPPSIADRGIAAALVYPPPSHIEPANNLRSAVAPYPVAVRYSPDGKTWSVPAGPVLATFSRPEGKWKGAVPFPGGMIGDPVVSVSSNLEWAVSADSKTITVFNVSDPGQQWVVPVLEHAPQDVACKVSPDGETLLEFHVSRLHLRKEDGSHLEIELRKEPNPAVCRFSPDGSLFVTRVGEVLRFYDLKSFDAAGEMQVVHAPNIGQIVFSGDSSTIAWCYAMGYNSVGVQRITRGAGGVVPDGEAAVFHHPYRARAVALNRYGSLAASAYATDDGLPTHVNVWNTRSGQAQLPLAFSQELFGEPPPALRPSRDKPLIPVRMSFSPQGDELALSTLANRLLLLSLDSSPDELTANAGAIEPIAFESVAKAATGSEVYNESPAFHGEIDLPDPPDPDYAERTRSVSFSPDGRHVRVYDGKAFLVFDWETRQLLHQIDFVGNEPETAAERGGNFQAVISDDGNVAAFLGPNGSVHIVEQGADTFDHLEYVDRRSKTAVKQYLLGFSSDGKRLYSRIQADGNDTVLVWDLGRKRVSRDYPMGVRLAGEQFAGDGEVFCGCTLNVLSIIDPKRFKPDVQIEVFTGPSRQQARLLFVTMAGNRTAVVAASEQEYFVWREEKDVDKLSADAEPVRIPERGDIRSILLDGSGRFLLSGVNVTAQREGRSAPATAVRFRDLQSGKIVAELTGFPPGSNVATSRDVCFAFSQDAARAAVASTDKLFLFDVRQLLSE